MEENKRSGRILLENRERLTISGVIDVGGFSEEYVELSSELGCMIVEGANLKIEELSRQTKEIHIRGEISGIFYKDAKLPKGFLGKIFK